MKKVIFLDRDGVINKDPGGWTEHNYITRWEQFKFLPNSIKALKMLTQANYDIVVISNQAGISKGYYNTVQLDEVNRKMVEEIKKNGAALKKIYYCVHQDNDNCNCRKPKIGLFKKAEKELGIKAQGNFFIGDGKMDIEAGEKMGLRTILVLSGKTTLEALRGWSVKPDFIFDDLIEAVEFLLNKGYGKD